MWEQSLFSGMFQWFQHKPSFGIFFPVAHPFFSVQNQVSADFNPRKSAGAQDSWDLCVLLLNRELLIVYLIIAALDCAL